MGIASGRGQAVRNALLRISTETASPVILRNPLCWILSVVLAAGCLCVPPSLAKSATEAGTTDLEPHWQEVRRLMAKQDYRGALQELSLILTSTPRDPVALAYRTLCEKRLSASSAVRPASPEALSSLEEQLRQEQRAHGRESAQQRALQHQIAKQQAKADAQLKAVTEQIRKERERREAERRGRAPIISYRGPAPPTQAAPSIPSRFFGWLVGRPGASAPGIPRLPRSQPLQSPEGVARGKAEPKPQEVEREAEEPVLEQPFRAVVSGASPSKTVELEPVTVPTGEPPEEEEELPPRPPGAVQIFADHMNVAQDRQVATATGHVRILFEQGSMTADRMILFTDTKDVYAKGNVHVRRGKEVYRGELVHYNIDTQKGRFLTGTASKEPWHQHGSVIEHVAEGVLRVKSGYLTSCEFEPPHFRFQGRSSTILADEGVLRGRHVTLAIEEFPFIYLPWLSAADRQSPFFIIPGKKEPWEHFALMGYRYEWPEGHQGALRLDWRRAFAWGTGIDHRFEDKRFGKGLVKLYYNDEHNIRRKEDDLPKGAGDRRYRALVRHQWDPLPGVSLVTNLQKFSDADFRKEFLFREEFVEDDNPDSFVSMIVGDPAYSLSAVVRKRLNRFQTITEAFPDMTMTTRQQRIGETNFFADTTMRFANLQTKRAHSENDTDVVQASWRQDLKYAWNLFQPIQLTPKLAVQQDYHTKDKQGGVERPQGARDVISGQFSGGLEASLKLFRIFPVVTDALGLNINWLRHVVTPTIAYNYTHRPTVPNDNLSFGMAAGGANQLTFGLENKWQTKRQVAVSKTETAALAIQTPQAGTTIKGQRVDLARFLLSVPYSFRGHQNKQGGRLGDWTFDLELYPWPWLRLESNWGYPSHFLKGSRDRRMTNWNLDLVAVGGGREATAAEASDIQAPQRRSQELGPQLTRGLPLLPQGQWYLGLGHRYSYNDKTENVLQFDWRLSEKWQIGTFHRFTWKEVAGGSKRFLNTRERQYVLTRDLHDWMAELVYRVDREFGEELYFTMTLKAYPNVPIEIAESYHQPKFGSQSSPFSPIK